MIKPLAYERAPSDLIWWSYGVINVMHRKGIRDRKHLAKVLRLANSTIYEAFDEGWRGRASAAVLARVAGVLNVPLNQLVVEPAAKFRARQTV